MTLSKRDFLALGAAAGASMTLPAWAQAKPLIASINMFVPAAPGGGWDGTARAIERAAKAAGLVGTMQFENVGGAGGMVGLPRYVNQRKGQGNSLMVGGSVMIGAGIANKSPVTIKNVTPIARLTGEAVGIAVPAASPLQTIGDLVDMLKADPGSVSWAGGSAGGVDHITVGLLAKAAGVDPTKINYVAFSGGGEALAAILGNQVTVGISGVGEFLPQVEAGTMRMLAVSTAEKWPGTDAPTLKESGYDVNVQNWRMVAAAPGLSDEQKATVAADIDKLVNSAGWKAMLETKGWANTYLAGADFDAQLAKEIESTTAVLKDIGLVK